MKDDNMAFLEQLRSAVILGTKMVEHEICLLTLALNDIGHVHNTVNREVAPFRAVPSR